MSEEIKNEITVTSVNELTKEEKKKIRKLKFKYYGKLFGIGAGIAAVSATIAYFVGKHTGIKEMDLDYASKIYDYASTGQFASKINFVDGTSKYLLYSIADEKPEWWDTAKYKDVDLTKTVEETLKEG